MNKFVQEAIINQEARQYGEDKQKREAIYQKITKGIKFISKFVKKCQGCQTGEKTVFYDIDIEKMPQANTWEEFKELSYKYEQLRGRSLNLSTYVSIRQSMLLNHSVSKYIIPAVKWAYENYVKENFYGKEIEFDGEKCKAFQIDWFDEVYVADEKIKTSFQKKIEEIEEKWRIEANELYEHLKQYEPEGWERARIDYVNRYDIYNYLYNCKDMLRHPENHSGIKNIDEYIKEAEKILHKKIR